MATITINGASYLGNNIQVQSNGNIIIDGKSTIIEDKQINIEIQGNINNLDIKSCDKISVVGNVYKLKSVSGDIDISGNVSGDIDSTSGDIKCYDVKGNVKTISGDIKYNK